MDWSERRTRFRKHLQGDKCLRPASVYDPISARIAEDLEFEIGMLAGSIASSAVIGAPDLILLALSEFADQAYRICRAGNLALLVDADHGYGNALNVRRTVEELETAGVCGMTIEDTELPHPFGSSGLSRLIPIEEGVGKLKAALDARQDPKLVISGRTSAPALTDMDDTIARAKAYEAVGVDAMFFTGVKTREQIEAIAANIDIPIILGNTPEKLADYDYLAANQVRIVLQGHIPFMAAVKSVHDTLKALKDGAHPADLSDTYSQNLMKQVTRDDDYKGWMDEYLRG